MADDARGVECPVCGQFYPENVVNTHVNKCIEGQSEGPKRKTRSDATDNAETGLSQQKKRQKRTVAQAQGPCPCKNQVSGTTVCIDDEDDDFESSASDATCTNDIPNSVPKSPEKSNSNDSSKNKAKTQAQAWGSLASGKFMKPPSALPPTQGKQKSPTKNNKFKTVSNMKQPQPQSPNAVTVPSSQSRSQIQPSQSDVPVPDTNSRLLSSRSTPGTSSPSSATPQLSFRKPADKKQKFAPLAEQMRPTSLEDYLGQDKALGRNTMLRSLLKSNNIPSMILWGPPGCGKTTLARILAQQSKASSNTRFVQLSATTAGIADVKEVVKVAKNEQSLFKRRTILFVDEVHRFNKLQQDSFLPHVEDGTIILIGATTENPSFQVNNALLSRCRVIVLEKLSVESVENILKRALVKLQVSLTGDDQTETERGGDDGICIEDAALTTLAHLCDGDARVALNSLQIAVDSKRCSLTSSEYETDSHQSKETAQVIGVEDIKEGLQRSSIKYDRAGEEHYNCASAFQKSIRGSDDNGAIYWLARMLEGGENPLFIARRLVVCASEDIGLADPQALVQAVSTFQACNFVGMPECAINLAQCTTYLARAPKSIESFSALNKARESIKQHEGPLPGVPLHLRNASTKLMKDLGYGKGYKYNHASDEPVDQEYLPEELQGVNFFE